MTISIGGASITGERKPRSSQGAPNCARVGHADCREAERKPSASQINGGCAQVAVHGHGLISVRNDNTAEIPAHLLGPVCFTAAGWRDLVKAIKDGTASWPKVNGLRMLRAAEQAVPAGLHGVVGFTAGEWQAFTAGIKAGEFDLGDDDRLPPADGAQPE